MTSMHGARTVAAALGVAAALLLQLPPHPAVARLADPTATTLTLAGIRTFADSETALTARLVDDAGTPVAGSEVVLSRRVSGAWTEIARRVTDESGSVSSSAVLLRSPSDNVFRADFAGSDAASASTSGPVEVELRQRRSRVTLDGSDQVVDETTVILRVRRLTRSGAPVPGAVRVDRRLPGEDWRRYRRLQLDAHGRGEFEVGPRVDTKWRVVAPSYPWVAAARSAVHYLDNVPPGVPVIVPRAPHPRITLPRQRRALGRGPHPVVSLIPSGVWQSMVGRSWHRGCPVGRAGLRLVRINYWGYDGYRHRGELVVAQAAAGPSVRAFSALYRRRFPIRAMYRVDRFGYSSRVHGADDYKSMAAGNTSGFNCRWVVGRPGVMSPHATGRAIDINTWENPYRTPQGWVPNTWWVGRSHPRVAWRSGSHPVVAILRNAGFAWTYDTADSQHFDLRGGSGRLVSRRGCVGVCD